MHLLADSIDLKAIIPKTVTEAIMDTRPLIEATKIASD
jgi:hypothetical protein